MPFTVLIPARLASTRLPNKPLADIGGLPMVVRVAQQAAKSAASRVVVAADDESIVLVCRQHGVEAVLTGSHHLSGSDRLAEACDLLGLANEAVVVNVQGDEPLISPTLIDDVANLLTQRLQASMATAAHPVQTAADFQNPNVVKVVLDAHGHALYFSRAPIPCVRDAVGPDAWQVSRPLRHIGLYAYRAEFLRSFVLLAPAPLEAAEALEQLRVLWHGLRIAVQVSPSAPAAGVDTAEDLARVRQVFSALEKP